MSTKRDELRGTVLSSKQFEHKTVSFRGGIVEVRQPSLGFILETQKLAENDTHVAVTHAIINCCYVPDTNELLFEEGDKQAILNFPFDADLLALQKAITALTGIDIEGEEKNSEETP